MRLRTIPEATRILHQQDPETAITETGLRRKVNAGQIPVVMMGSKRLVDVDKLEEQLYRVVIDQPEPLKPGQMRRIAE